jgi:6-pyruvoyltetrahydropterin/6-carboxytetrahydropterin synthase
VNPFVYPPTTVTVTRRFEFDAAHRVLGHQGQCASLHGHRYVAEVTVSSPRLDDLGMVVDFGVVKEKVGEWIDEYWDHNFIAHHEDPLVRDVLPVPYRVNNPQKFPFVMPAELGNPTAENMARHLFLVVTNRLSGFRVERVRLYETPNCWADCYPEEE